MRKILLPIIAGILFPIIICAQTPRIILKTVNEIGSAINLRFEAEPADINNIVVHSTD
jgi:hypothetical protein